MNWYRELERITEPPPRASEVVCLSQRDIQGLCDRGLITRVESIPRDRYLPRVVFPKGWHFVY